jgi:hypothetical protein
MDALEYSERRVHCQLYLAKKKKKYRISSHFSLYIQSF